MYLAQFLMDFFALDKYHLLLSISAFRLMACYSTISVFFNYFLISQNLSFSICIYQFLIYFLKYFCIGCKLYTCICLHFFSWCIIAWSQYFRITAKLDESVIYNISCSIMIKVKSNREIFIFRQTAATTVEAIAIDHLHKLYSS